MRVCARPPDSDRSFKDRANGQESTQFVRCHGGQPHGRNAPAGTAIGIAAELARNHASLEVGRENAGGLGENTLRRISRGCHKLANQALRHIQFWKDRAQQQHVRNGRGALCGFQDFVHLIADLRREKTEPHLPNFLPGRPEFQESPKVSGTRHHLARHRAMNRDLLAGDVPDDPVVSRGRSPHIVLGLQPVYRDHDVQMIH